MEPVTQKATTSSVCIKDSQVLFTQNGTELARISISDIKLIGEYTTANGPFVDDWFIVFMTSAEKWIQISEYTAGMQEVLKELSTLFKAEIVGSLFASISWKTNVIWPAGIEGAEMWDLQIQPPVTLVQKLKTWVGLGGNPKLVLTPAAATAFS